MKDSQQHLELLFSYGTLQQQDVQRDTFGRLLKGIKDSVLGYVIDQIRISNKEVLTTSGKEFHPILRKTNRSEDQVQGTVFQLTRQELAQADEYEVDDYVRVSAVTKLGQQVWVYVAKIAA